MKKLIALCAFLCLAVGTTGASGSQKNSGSIDTKKLEYPIPYIPVEGRATILPKHNICSIAPAAESSDDFITGNGTLRLQTSGQPYNEVMSYTHELLFEPKWAQTPMPPDMRPYLPRIRQLLLEGKADEANALVDEAQIKAGFDKVMNFDNKILYNYILPGIFRLGIIPKILFVGGMIFSGFLFRKRSFFFQFLAYTGLLIILTTALTNQYLAIPQVFTSVFYYPFGLLYNLSGILFYCKNPMATYNRALYFLAPILLLCVFAWINRKRIAKTLRKFADILEK